ncbi:Non-reducing end alpha-L-arabinofuranosidase BoGH43B [Colletotrichum trifolii]|uniref:Non-reducing end alpha-L-arabinofuranosidase BoGH43B n=1 Tax=Colletotrichum trifolii TaxID=5466 RepID=A0A4R8R1F7_COLTR|nr:Non-reducing end alpha-L-arabinofuranosidase BoGH43B [Colletotrichum trifolii]
MKFSNLLAFGLLLVSSQAATLKCRDDTFTNPVLYEDYPDNDISVGPDGAFYFSASNFHYSPGAPILRSLDLVNWEPVGHSIPRMNFGDGYDLPPGGPRAYRSGTWASTLRYRESNGQWYWIGCANFWITWVFTATSVQGPWYNRANFGGGLCMYDNGLLIDDDDTMYVVYGNGQVKVSQLAADGLSVVRSEQVLQASDVNTETVEGNRMYKINGTYYILNDQPGSTTYVWKSSSPWGPYEAKILVKDVTPPLAGGNSPHQGSLVQTKDGTWYFMSFTWAYPAGRMPVLAPIAWGADGFPSLVKGSNGGWGSSYPLPLPARPLYNWTRTYNFENELGPTWEWNHNPDVASYEVDNGLTLRTASVTNDIYSARNTLTHRLHGEFPRGTVEIDFSNAADGDRFGLAASATRRRTLASTASAANTASRRCMASSSTSGPVRQSTPGGRSHLRRCRAASARSGSARSWTRGRRARGPPTSLTVSTGLRLRSWGRRMSCTLAGPFSSRTGLESSTLRQRRSAVRSGSSRLLRLESGWLDARIRDSGLVIVLRIRTCSMVVWSTTASRSRNSFYFALRRKYTMWKASCIVAPRY